MSSRPLDYLRDMIEGRGKAIQEEVEAASHKIERQAEEKETRKETEEKERTERDMTEKEQAQP